MLLTNASLTYSTVESDTTWCIFPYQLLLSLEVKYPNTSLSLSGGGDSGADCPGGSVVKLLVFRDYHRSRSFLGFVVRARGSSVITGVILS